jgi:transcriptional regulator with XRE-family HTH domain
MAATSIEYNQPFPSRLRQLMEERKTTQIVLADYVGVSRQTISQYMDGSAQPTITRFEKIAEYYSISSDYLLGRTDCRTLDMDVQAIHQKTGLTEESIKKLIRALQHPPLVEGIKQKILGYYDVNSPALFFSYIIEVANLHSLASKFEVATALAASFNGSRSISKPEDEARRREVDSNHMTKLSIDDAIEYYTHSIGSEIETHVDKLCKGILTYKREAYLTEHPYAEEEEQEKKLEYLQQLLSQDRLTAAIVHQKEVRNDGQEAR